MAATQQFVAFDLGAESGRAMVGEFDGSRMALAEVHRFANRPAQALGSLYWQVLDLWGGIKEGLSKVAAHYREVTSIGVDTWGVDFALLDRRGELLGMPHQYRDPRTRGMVEAAFAKAPKELIFAHTGIQFMEINTLYQLYSMVQADPHALDGAKTLLMMPDLFHYWLTGEPCAEYAIATTSQCYDLRAGEWARPVLERLGIPDRIFLPPVQPGTRLGVLHPSVVEEVGLSATVVAPASHDTASALAAVPATGPGFACISSGTWSVVATEQPEPVINETTLQANFTNQGNAGGQIGILKNVTGLWLVQQCRATWARQGQEHSYAELAQLAAQAPPLQALIDPDYPEFASPGDMPARLRAYCQATGQTPPVDKGGLIRAVLEGLALKYRHNLLLLEQIVGRRLDPLYIVGGGSQNTLLNQLTADATGRTVYAGPAEATALGNVLVQAIGAGEIGSLDEAREVVRRSIQLQHYTPQPDQAGRWAEAAERFSRLLAGQTVTDA